MKVLTIGQLPKEIGGNYTTGAANVVYELSVHQASTVEIYTFGTNISNRAAQRASRYSGQYIGYSFRPFSLFCGIFFHPIRSFKHLKHYKRIDRQNIFRYYFYENNIAHAIRVVQPDLIHVHSVTNLSPTRFALGKCNIPIVLTCHGITYKGEADKNADRIMYRGNIPLADYYTGSTKETAEEYEKYLGIPKTEVAIIPNGVDNKKIYYDVESRKKLRTNYAVSENQIVFLTIASVQERKGQLRFIRFLKNLNVDYQYWLIGDGPDMPNIIQYISDNGLGDRIKRIGYVDGRDLYKYYSAADIYAHASLNEGQALVELGANATGLRCVVSKEVINTVSGDINSGQYFKLDFETPDYSSFMNWLIQNNNKERKGNVPNWETVAEMYRNLYNKILNR